MANEKGYVVVRGGVSGAGRYISLKMAEAGYDVFAHTAEAIHNFRGDILKEECRALGVRCSYDDGDPNLYGRTSQWPLCHRRDSYRGLLRWGNSQNSGTWGQSRQPVPCSHPSAWHQCISQS